MGKKSAGSPQLKLGAVGEGCPLEPPRPSWGTAPPRASLGQNFTTAARSPTASQDWLATRRKSWRVAVDKTRFKAMIRLPGNYVDQPLKHQSGSDVVLRAAYVEGGRPGTLRSWDWTT